MVTRAVMADPKQRMVGSDLYGLSCRVGNKKVYFGYGKERVLNVQRLTGSKESKECWC